jgi:hypothetical protein
MADQPHA